MRSQPEEELLNTVLSNLDHSAVAQAYKRAYESTLIIHHRPPDRLRLTGADRLDLLERLSSNTFKGRGESEHVRTTLLEANGRLIDLLDVFIIASELFIATTPGHGQAVHAWLAKHIFFQDHARVELIDPWPMFVGVYGPQAENTLSDVFGDLTTIDPPHFHTFDQALVLPLYSSGVSGFEVYGCADIITEVFSQRGQNSAGSSAYSAYEALRIEAGIPRRGHEITPGIIPLEAGLVDTISFNKECYIGQEVIARLDSRGELASILTAVRLSKPARIGTSLVQTGKEIGTLTSIAYSPQNGWVGLAFLKSRRWDSSRGDITIAGDSAHLQQLPFPSS